MTAGYERECVACAALSFSRHRQVALPELGFAVDEGLEELIRACWRRGIATAESCIGTSHRGRNGDAVLFFCDFASASRWERVTGLGNVEAFHTSEDREDDEDYEGEWIISSYFPAADIPDITDALATVAPAEAKEFRAEVQRHNDRREEEQRKLAALDPFHLEVRRRRLEREVSR